MIEGFKGGGAGDKITILSGGLDTLSLTLSTSDTFVLLDFFFLAALDFLPGVPGGAGVSGKGTAAATLTDRLRPGAGAGSVVVLNSSSSSGRGTPVVALGVRRIVNLSGRKRFGMSSVSSSSSRILVAISVYPGNRISFCPNPSEMSDLRSGVYPLSWEAVYC